MLTFPEKVLGVVGESVVVGVDVTNMKNLRLFLTLILLAESRTFTSKIIKISTLLIKPIPSLIKSIHTWAPVTASTITTHALSGATTQVYSKSENSITLKVGESLDYEFFTSPYSAQSFEITGLPAGINSKLTYGVGGLSGIIPKPGNYKIEITGYRNPGYNGNSTPPFILHLNVESNESISVISFFDANGISDQGNAWFNSTWFGLFYTTSNNSWIYHSHLKWMYINSNIKDSLWLYDNEHGWLFTSKELYPFFYKHSEGQWLYHLKNSKVHRFWDYSVNSEV